ncbi:MAG TPA: hypothetical protein EYH34_02805 [Planctomycetes bacterium]|nr:hypothetical protein [Planctomycetota bacterium]
MVDRLLAASRFGRERKEIVQQNADRVFACPIEVDKVERTFGYVPDERLRNGRTLMGVVAGTSCAVLARLAVHRNEELEGVDPGQTVLVSGRLVKWNDLYDRLELEEA